ncbi:tautomerase family protein [Pseudomonas citri]|uniref:tautomerase family protein n=1 Tax=Pseudomonas citri TaxID=2978349 RepID=UPI0021B6B694|nr:tautomerase family protein [Pseudomonas citri]
MPLLKIDVVEGRSDEAIQRLLDTTHRAMVDAFQVPERDRYQILNEHAPNRMIVQDTGLGFERTDQVIVITVISRPRSVEMKKQFYSQLTEGLKRNCGIASTDVMVSIITNADEDWSFGLGQAQFLTGEL